jgi:hypothetical protein
VSDSVSLSIVSAIFRRQAKPPAGNASRARKAAGYLPYLTFSLLIPLILLKTSKKHLNR